MKDLGTKLVCIKDSLSQITMPATKENAEAALRAHAILDMMIKDAVEEKEGEDK